MKGDRGPGPRVVLSHVGPSQEDSISYSCVQVGSYTQLLAFSKGKGAFVFLTL